MQNISRENALDSPSSSGHPVRHWRLGPRELACAIGPSDIMVWLPFVSHVLHRGFVSAALRGQLASHAIPLSEQYRRTRGYLRICYLCFFLIAPPRHIYAAPHAFLESDWRLSPIFLSSSSASLCRSTTQRANTHACFTTKSLLHHYVLPEVYHSFVLPPSRGRPSTSTSSFHK